ncbi:undecaprenyl-diphosphate phosphatase [Luteolibacter flavescens]|uniref:Undecaprenyl-diphosphatase n=1 Tax=Luteolibacter flavescens TaxID=1859460 RepID=A0ABT3FVA2_9BACT|nr:undecaprenyl-diphosphate phosphatase [Luteolibacter flavescens]MCW1887490.1 undecaprenyl-diphosphate phosphatase [Luteolibacter flavescens]
MNWWQALILGIIEGLTEYLPVSSTGHLIVAQRMMGIGIDADPFQAALENEAANCFAICVQGGAILAVAGLYWPRVRQMILGLFGKDKEGLKLVLALICAFMPAAVIGLLANDWIEAKLFHFKWVAIAWFVGGLGILGVARWMKKGGGSKGVELAEITIKMALVIGFAQCIAMWPGTSRSLMTIIGALFIGLRLSAAVEFSFLLGLLTLGAATAKKAVWGVDLAEKWQHLPGYETQVALHAVAEKYDQKLGGAQLMWDTYGLVPLAVGVIAATISAAIAVKWMVSYLNRKGLGVFGWYRIAIAAIAAVLIGTNTLGLGAG